MSRVKKRLNLALVAHDNRKEDLISWASFNRGTLEPHLIHATGTTGRLLQEACPELEIVRMQSGPLGGDQEIGAMIAKGEVDGLFFFWDPMTPQPHDPDVKALLRMAVLKNIIIVEDRTTADMVISSPLFADPEYERVQKDYGKYIKRSI